MKKYYTKDLFGAKNRSPEKNDDGFLKNHFHVNERKRIYMDESELQASFYVDENFSISDSLARQHEKFTDWINFLEEKAKDAFESKRRNKNNYCIIHDLKKDVLEKYNERKYEYLESFLNESSEDVEVSLPSLFNSVRFIYEIPADVIDRSFFFIDQDSSYVNMAFVNRESRLDLTFKDNGEISFRFVDCEDGRVRITGTSFFGVGKNQKETKKINKLLNLVKKDF